MFIQYVRVKNYRSFADVSMYFNEQANYLVGENSIGKSSVLKLLSMLASGTGLDESDYADPSRPVVVIADIVLHGEQEKFVNEQERQETRVRLRFEKRIEEISPRLYNDENGQMLPLNLIRRFRYIFHSSVMPEQHILTAHVHKMLEHQLKDLCGTELDIVLPKEVWAFAQQQELHGNYDASYYVNIMYLSRLLSREDRPLADNMKFISIVALKIIAQVELMYHSHAVPFSHGLVRGVDGKIYLPLVIAIDEPEVHLQPYLQRSILTYYKQLLHNQDPAFCQLLKKLFNVDGLQGQLFIVTHSTDCLVDDYRNIIRFYRDEHNQVCAACGTTFRFSEEIQKHLIMHFPEIKEALYSRSVIIVEGETEYGCFNLFGTTLGIRFDYYGICLINARGESSISKIRTLLRSFKIPVVCLYDADVREFRQQKDPCIFFTDQICFEMDLVKSMLDHGRRKLLDEIIYNVDGMPGRATGDMLRKACHKLNLDRQAYPSCDLASAQPRLPDSLYVYYFAWLYSNKGVVLGRLLGGSLRANEIPPAFVRVIQAAGRLAKVNARL